MSDLAITAATALLGADTASGDLFPVVDVSASTPKGRSITRDELGAAMVTTSALTTALAAKLDKAGGTMTGALAITQGTANAAVLTSTGYSLTGSNATGMVSLTGTLNTTGVPSVLKLATTVTAAGSGTKLLEVLGSSSGAQNVFSVMGAATQTGTAYLQVGSYFIGDYAGAGSLWWGTTNNPFAAQVALDYQGVRVFNGGAFAFANDSFGNAAEDLVLLRATTASLQLGRNHATTATAQTIKAHNVTTGTGAALILCGGTGSVAGGSVKLAAPSTTGAGVTAVEVGPGGLLGFFGAGPQTQPSTGGSSASFVENGGTALNENSTFDNYTIAQVVTALRNLGLLA